MVSDALPLLEQSVSMEAMETVSGPVNVRPSEAIFCASAASMSHWHFPVRWPGVLPYVYTTG